MIVDRHYDDKFFWPKGVRMVIGLTFDVQGGEPIRPGKNGLLNIEDYEIGEYDPNTGVWRLLRILEDEGIKGTFLTCGGIVERFPELARAVVAKGHELAGHGYHHEVARELPKDEEREVIRKTIERQKATVGFRPAGWRTCTQSTNTNDLLLDFDFQWNSNSFSFDLPFLRERDGKVMVELPRHIFGDGRIYGHFDGGTPENARSIWMSAFDELYDESRDRPTYMPFQIHPAISGRPGRARAFRDTLRHIKGRDGIWFATGTEIATWCLDNVFAQKTAAAAE